MGEHVAGSRRERHGPGCILSAGPRILVASGVVADADLVRKLLRDEFDTVTTSTNLDRAVEDVETTRPQVLILAFNGLQDAEQYYLGLYRRSTLVHALPHRTVILCNKEDLRRVYGLCKKDYFDDYVLFWPMTNARHVVLLPGQHAGDRALPAPAWWSSRRTR